MSGNSNYVLPFNYLGSKYGQLKWLLPLIPQPIKNVNNHFVELFGGSAVVTLNSPRYPINTINDINGDVITFFKVLRDNSDELIKSLYLTPHSHEEYKNSWSRQSDNEIERARKFYIRLRQSFGSMGGQKKSKGWLLATKQSRCKISEATNKWLSGVDGLYEIVSLLKCIQFENRHYKTLLPLINDKSTVIYADPTYEYDSSPASKEYVNSLNNEDHEELSKGLHEHLGKVILSGYDSPFMQKLYGDWIFIKAPVHKRTMGSMSKNSKTKLSIRQECVWCNFDPFMEKPNLFNQ